MIFQDELNIWCQMGVGRQSALAKQIGSARAYISKICCQGVPVSDDQEKRLRTAIKRIEKRESNNENSVRNNILKCAKITSHPDKTVAKEARFKLIYWSEIYGGF